ncbi:MAG TPA: response regulator [Patescibacteria group bacterium]|nr:response regulator [Patescibacteria group bacterium]
MQDPANQQYSILVVEDEQLLRDVLVQKFQEAGFTVYGAKDGKEGYDSAIKYHPHLILMDIMMPGMDGIAVLKQLRKDPWGKEVSIILLTNVSDPRLVAESLEEGGLEYLVKTDWDIDEVVAKVRDTVRSRVQPTA